MVLDASQGGGGYLPPDLQLTDEEAAKAAASTSASSYTKTIDLPLVKYKKYKFQASYLYLDEKTNSQIEGNRSPWLETTFDIPNNTKPVINLVLTQGIKSYGIKFDFQAGSEHEDVIVYESLTGAFAGEQYIVYVGTANSMTINTSDFANRWVKVVTRDRWLDTNISSATAGPVKPLNADPDTSTAPSAPSYASVVGSIDANDKSGFSGKITASWTANTDTNTSGYVIRWTTQNPATTQNPIWEYGQVEGKATTTFSVTGLLPNTLYYYQVTAKSPYNALSWASPQSGTFGPIVDSTAPADAYAQLKSIISIGGKTADLFKIGTGIAQGINTSTTSTPDLVSGTYSGIILNKSTTNYGHNYWLNTGQFRVGSSSAFLFWDGSDLYTTGKINATGGVFSGDVGITNGSIYAGSSPTSGARVRMNTGGFFAYDTNGVQTISISTVDGKIDARKGYIGGWTIDGTAQTIGSIYSSNTKLESSGNLTLGDTSGTLASIVKLSASDTAYRLWVGSQTAANAPFRVTKEGKLYANGAVFGPGSTVDGYATSTQLSAVDTKATNAASAAATAQSTATTASTNATNATTTANNAFTKANAALPSSSFNRSAIVQYINSTTNNPTNTTSIDGGTLITGTVSANAVVADFISAFSINADKITAGTLTGRDISIAGDSDYNRFRTSYPRYTAYNSVGPYSVLGINGIAMVSQNTSGVVSHWYPFLDNDASLGTTTYHWRTLFATNSTINTSDFRVKKNIQGSDLGLEFIKSLNPVKFNKIYKTAVPKSNDEGNALLDENGERIIDRIISTEGERYHYGFIAQEVKEKLDEFGVGDTFAGWTLDDPNDPDSRQGLAYEQFISPLAKAVQELSNMVESLQQEVNTLKGI